VHKYLFVLLKIRPEHHLKHGLSSFWLVVKLLISPWWYRQIQSMLITASVELRLQKLKIVTNMWWILWMHTGVKTVDA